MSAVRFRIILLVSALMAIILGAAAGFMVLEDLSFGEALYFSIITVSTVGYGNIYPTTTGSKVVAVFLVITGVGIFLTVTADIIRALLERGQERTRREHLHMLIGVFFSEIGTSLLHVITGFDPELERICRDCLIEESWSDRDFHQLDTELRAYHYGIDPGLVDLESVTLVLKDKGDLLVRLYENPSLLEHESFTDLLRALLHLREELITRSEPLVPDERELAHLANDLRRVYSLLAKQWVSYMHYLKDAYPYLFSLALRTNPFAAGPVPAA